MIKLENDSPSSARPPAKKGDAGAGAEDQAQASSLGGEAAEEVKQKSEPVKSEPFSYGTITTKMEI